MGARRGPEGGCLFDFEYEVDGVGWWWALIQGWALIRGELNYCRSTPTRQQPTLYPHDGGLIKT